MCAHLLRQLAACIVLINLNTYRLLCFSLAKRTLTNTQALLRQIVPASTTALNTIASTTAFKQLPVTYMLRPDIYQIYACNQMALQKTFLA